MEWLGHAKTTFTHSPNPLSLTKKDGTSTDLASLCREATPPCRLNPLLFNGHLQTMWTAVKNHGPPIYYKRKVFENEDPNFRGSFAVDFVVSPFPETDENLSPRTVHFTEEEFETFGSIDTRPMLVVLHGLSGGSHEICTYPCSPSYEPPDTPCNNPTVRFETSISSFSDRGRRQTMGCVCGQF